MPYVFLNGLIYALCLGGNNIETEIIVCLE